MKYIYIVIVLLSIYVNVKGTENLIPYRDGIKWGYCDSTKKIIIKPEYDSVNVFREGRALVYKNGFCGFIDEKGKIIIPIKYFRCKDFFNEKASVVYSSNNIYFNLKGKNITNPKINSVDYFNGLTIVSQYKEDRFYKAIIDSLGNVIVPSKYFDIRFICNYDTCLTVVENNDSVYLLKKDLSLSLLKYKFFISSSTEGTRVPSIDPYFAVMGDSGVGFIDKHLQEIIPPKYHHTDGFINDFGLVEKINYEKINKGEITPIESRKIIYVDKYGKELPDDNYIEGGHFNEGRAFVVKVIDSLGGIQRYGFIDKKGKVVIPIQYCIYSCSGKLTNAAYRNSWTHTNTLMWDDVLETEANKRSNEFDSFFWDAYDFHEGLARIWDNMLAGYIDTTGKIIINPQFEMAGYFKDGLAPVKIKRKYGFIDHWGNIVINPKYSEVKYFENGIAEVKIANKKGYINRNGLEYFRN
jgi:hypothetical protein